MPPEPETTARRLVVHGRVQGVNFRAATARTARQTGAAGWVRNREDGAVEAHVEGSPGAVERVEAFCNEGPRGAAVERVEAADAAPEGLDGFKVR